jgi:hypothetical protein
MATRGWPVAERRSLYERIAFPVLRRLDPEVAHRLVMAVAVALSRVVGVGVWLRRVVTRG